MAQWRVRISLNLSPCDHDAGADARCTIQCNLLANNSGAISLQLLSVLLPREVLASRAWPSARRWTLFIGRGLSHDSKFDMYDLLEATSMPSQFSASANTCTAVDSARVVLITSAAHADSPAHVINSAGWSWTEATCWQIG